MKKFLLSRSLLAGVVLLGLSVCAAMAQEGDKASELEARVANLEEFSRGLSPQLNDFSRGLYADIDQRMKVMSDKLVSLNLVSKQFSKIETNAGDFLIAVDRREKTDAGYKIIFKIGNPHSATYGDAKLKVWWGKNWDPTFVNPTYAEWRKSLSGAEFSYPGSIEPGVWTEIAVVLPEANDAVIEYLECEMSVGSVKLQAK